VSRLDHIVARRREDPRAPRVQYTQSSARGYRFSVKNWTSKWHKQGSSWGRTRVADLAERRAGRAPQRVQTPSPSAAKIGAATERAIARIRAMPAPEGMSRQVRRALTRRAETTARAALSRAGA
jgi:hypothetical protein